jgi:ribokinase
VVGNDFPDNYVEFLIEKGICTKGLAISDGATFKWHGQYNGDMNQANTLKTDLGVFADFKPSIPEEYKKARYLFLANIDPAIQKSVIEQMENPELIVMDTMNYWIENKKEELFDVIEMCDIVIMNSEEANQLFETHNTIQAGKQLLKTGLKAAIIKKGEHGALVFTNPTDADGRHLISVFSAPAYPLEDVKDPTGAGDSFAGGFMGWLAKTGDISDENIRKAVIYGSACASYSAQGFGLSQLKEIAMEDIEQRYDEFKKISEF